MTVYDSLRIPHSSLDNVMALKDNLLSTDTRKYKEEGKTAHLRLQWNDALEQVGAHLVVNSTVMGFSNYQMNYTNKETLLFLHKINNRLKGSVKELWTRHFSSVISRMCSWLCKKKPKY